jgi:hypothetical protein
MRAGCHFLVNSLSRSRKRVAGISLRVWSGEHSVVLSDDITTNHRLVVERSPLAGSRRTSRRMHLRLSDIDRLFPMYRVTQAVG